jgi:hypothetical protein
MLVPSDPRSQTAPMDAIADVIADFDAGYCNPLETLSSIRGIVIEWRI